MKVLVFDTETSGLPVERNGSIYQSFNWPYIVQLSYMIYDSETNLLVGLENDYIDIPKDVTINQMELEEYPESVKMRSYKPTIKASNRQIKKAADLIANSKKPILYSKNNNIINIIDQRVFKLTPYFFSYTISKTGLYTLTKTSAMNFAPKIRVNGIAPGPTIKNQRQTEKHFKKQYLATPLKKQVDVNEICNAVDFFIKNSSITGQVLAIDSGQNLNWQTPDVIGKE